MVLLTVIKWLFYILVFPGLLFTLAAGLLLAGISRKIVARMQKRVGPPILQPLYDFLKLCGKEVIIPRRANKKVFLAAPVIGFASLIVTALVLPVTATFTAFSGQADIIVVLYLLTIPAAAIMFGAAASGSPFAGVGMSREMVAVMSYELPLVMILMAVCRVAGLSTESGMCFSLQGIVQYQVENGPLLLHFSMIPAWIAMLFVIPCEAGTHPFDIAEAETEICEGTMVEYTGLPLGIFELSHAVKSYVLCMFFCVLFLGGVTTGTFLVDLVIRLVLCFIVTFICITVPRAVCARLKVEQVFKFYWTVVAALALAALLLAWIGL